MSATLTANSNEYEFIFRKNDNDLQKNLVLVSMQSREGGCRPGNTSNGGNGAFLGTLDGANLWVYAFEGDESSQYAHEGHKYFRISAGDTNIKDSGDFMMFQFDAPGGFVSGTIDNNNCYGGTHSIIHNSIIQRS